MGAEVTLISANVSLPVPRGVELVPVVSTRDMYEAVMKRLDAQDLIIKTAAVADYRPAVQSAQKIKKSEEQMTLVLEKTEDILAEIGRRKKGQFIIGFAAETEHLEEHAMKKVRSKGCDLIAANDVSQQGIGFGADHNELHIFDQNGLVKKIPRSSKLEAARELLRLAAERMNAKKGNAAMIASVIVDVAAKQTDRPFDYLVPEGMREWIEVGSRVAVPFGPRLIQGFVVALSDTTEMRTKQTAAAVDHILDIQPPLTEELVRLGRWMSERYLCREITALTAMLPAALKAKYDRVLACASADAGRVGET